MTGIIGVHIQIKGIVQGVGFRPFVFGLANRFDVNGWVRNTSAGVDIQLDGTNESITKFVDALKSETPPLARIDSLEINECPSNGFSTFEIIHSQPLPDAFQPISPDVSMCDDCRSELYDPEDRRYRYPFINCTNCGPRFTIIEDIPYDRPYTTMASFEMCNECKTEYQDPLDRRFHAQPVACPSCGPRIWLEMEDPLTNELEIASDQVLETAKGLLREGKILAIKGLGGFHLACDALNSNAVSELRKRKLRVDKPFALMMPNIKTIKSHCLVDEEEQCLLESRQRPIVILERQHGSSISMQVAPGQKTLGVMLPYTPLHDLLFEDAPDSRGNSKFEALVMTSGNLSEEPISIDNQDARDRLASLADAFLLHDRPIRTRCDDSVTRIFHIPKEVMHDRTASSDTIPVLHLRRSRGYAPDPILLPWNFPPLLATGTELKNTFCFTRDNYAFLSHHIGDMENYETLTSFNDGITHFERLFRIQPQTIAYDLHPNYLATRYALERAERDGLTAIGVQHHHAHIAACMAEIGLDQENKVIGVSFDGTGYGEDGAIWGGDFLVANYKEYTRPLHLEYVPLPGGDNAIREPWRMALAWLEHAGVEWHESLPPLQFVFNEIRQPTLQLDILKKQITDLLNAPLTSSMGRLFDAVAALCGVRQSVNYEAQAAIEYEALVDPDEEGAYPIKINTSASTLEPETGKLGTIDPSQAFHAIVEDIKNRTSISTIAARFHNGIANMVLDSCQAIRAEYNLSSVVLSGGVWQNVTLLRESIRLLNDDDFTIFVHRKIPPNDGGVALGQAAIAAARLEN